MTGREGSAFEHLADWAEGRLSEDEAGALEERLARADEATRAEAAWLQAFSRASEDVALDAPPARLREELERDFAAYAEGRRQPGPMRRLVATLSFEDGAQAAFGVRSAASGEAQGSSSTPPRPRTSPSTFGRAPARAAWTSTARSSRPTTPAPTPSASSS